MANLVDNKEVTEKSGRISTHPVAVAKMFKGSLVMFNVAGFLTVAASLAGAKFAGIAGHSVDNTNGLVGDEECEVFRTGVFLLDGAGFTQASIGKDVFASDDQTVSTTDGGDEPLVGKVVNFVSATQVWVELKV